MICDAFRNTAATIYMCNLCLCIVTQKGVSHFLSLVVQQLQGIKYPSLFKRMNEKMNEWRRAVEGTEQPLRVGPRPRQCVSVYRLCVHAPPGVAVGNTFIIKQQNKLTLGWSCLVTALSRGPDETAKVLGEGGGDLQPFLTHSATRQLRGSTCKNKTKKKKQKQKSQTAQNGLNLIYSVVYTCN